MVGKVELYIYKRRTNKVPTFGMCKFHNPYCLPIVQHPIYKRISLSGRVVDLKMLSSLLEYRAFEGLVIVDFLRGER